MLWFGRCPALLQKLSGMCWAVQLLVGCCFQRNRVHILLQVTHAEIIPLRKTQEELSLFLPLLPGRTCGREEQGRCCEWGGLGLFWCIRKETAPKDDVVCQPTLWHPSQWQPLARGSLGEASLARWHASAPSLSLALTPALPCLSTASLLLPPHGH